jgi:tetratricopeptide (TPR) repeat protein
VEYLQQAIALDPSHAPSHAFLAGAWSTLAIYGVLPPREAFAAARAAASRAVELAPAMSEGHEMLGAIQLFFDWEPTAAMRSLDRAIELDPDSCNARHLRALALAQGGRHAAAMAELQRVLRADPLSLIAHTDVGYLHYWNRDFDAALAASEATLRLDASFAHVHLLRAYVLSAWVALPRRRRRWTSRSHWQASTDALRRQGLYPGPGGRCGRGPQHHRGAARGSASPLCRSFCRGAGLLGLGEHDPFFEWLERAAENRSRDLVLLEVLPVMDAVRHDPRNRSHPDATPKVPGLPAARESRRSCVDAAIFCRVRKSEVESW